jgi:segregation and condensation protein B
LDHLEKHLEALIFSSEDPVTAVDLGRCLSELFEVDFAQEEILSALNSITKKYESDEYIFQVVSIAGGYQFLTKPAYQPSISLLLKQKSKKRLSTTALETLSIIAYKQPITKAQIEAIRGVNSDYAIQRLLEKELVMIKGKSDGPGKPLLYGSGKKFMEYFGIMSLSELPQPKDFVAEDKELGPIDS